MILNCFCYSILCKVTFVQCISLRQSHSISIELDEIYDIEEKMS